MATTKIKVRAIAEHLEDVDDEILEMYIDDAGSELSGTDLAGNERAERYLTAHFASINIRRAESKSIESLKVSYSSTTIDKEGLRSTEYGQEVLRLFKKESGPNFRLIS